MSLPKVNVNVGEETVSIVNTEIPFVPAVILKTKSGPIGTVETITSEAHFKSVFGESDYTTPSAYAIQTYLRSYSYIYVSRVANEEDAEFGSGKISFTNASDTIDLIEAKSNYKTDLFNGKEVKLVYDNTAHKLWLDITSLVGKTTISIKEDYTADTATAVTLEGVLSKLVNSVNSAKLGVTFTNKFTNKTTSDKVPSLEDFTTGLNAFIQSGDSGNTTNVSDEDVKKIIALYDIPDRYIDAMVVPEYTNYTVVNYATELAKKNNFIFIVSAQGTNVEEAQTSVANYTKENNGSLAIYFPNVYYSNFNDNNGNPQAIPVSIAVLHTYAKTDAIAKWGAPAGVTRGTLSLVNNTTVALSEDMISQLYDGTTPINCINNISGRGFIVWGNKTTSTESPFFDRINVARLVKFVTKRVYDISWDYLFEPITLDVFTSWTLRVDNLLSTIKSSYGVADYKVVMDSSINTAETISANQLNGIVKIKPQEVAEFINIDFTIADIVNVSVEA